MRVLLVYFSCFRVAFSCGYPHIRALSHLRMASDSSSGTVGGDDASAYTATAVYALEEFMSHKERCTDPPTADFSVEKLLGINSSKSPSIQPGENAWHPRQNTGFDEERQFVQSVQGMLNRIAPEKYNKVMCHFLSPWILTGPVQGPVVEKIFNKALVEPNYSELYARLCRDVASYEAQQRDGSSSFRRAVVLRAQEEFEAMYNDIIGAQGTQEGISPEEAEELECRRRSRYKNNCKFVGKLFLHKMILDNVLHHIASRLLSGQGTASGWPSPLELEVAVELLETVGSVLDGTAVPDSKKHLDQHFAAIHKLIESKHYTARIIFKLQDLVDMRENGWVARIQRNDTQQPMTLNELALAEERRGHLRQGSTSSTNSVPRHRNPHPLSPTFGTPTTPFQSRPSGWKGHQRSHTGSTPVSHHPPGRNDFFSRSTDFGTSPNLAPHIPPPVLPRKVSKKPNVPEPVTSPEESGHSRTSSISPVPARLYSSAAVVAALECAINEYREEEEEREDEEEEEDDGVVWLGKIKMFEQHKIKHDKPDSVDPVVVSVVCELLLIGGQSSKEVVHSKIPAMIRDVMFNVMSVNLSFIDALAVATKDGLSEDAPRLHQRLSKMYLQSYTFSSTDELVTNACDVTHATIRSCLRHSRRTSSEEEEHETAAEDLSRFWAHLIPQWIEMHGAGEGVRGATVARACDCAASPGYGTLTTTILRLLTKKCLTDAGRKEVREWAGLEKTKKEVLLLLNDESCRLITSVGKPT